jgi:hypothetical protein
MKQFFLALIILVAAASSCHAEKLVWKTETDFEKEIGPSGECSPKDEQCIQADHVAYASISHYGRTVYLTYEEASRAYVSFDLSLDSDVKRESQSTFAMAQIAPGAFDWGGVIEGAMFKPLYVIKRFYDPGYDYSYDKVDQTKSGLVVWRLSETPGRGRSVTIGEVSENAEARAVAERDFAERQKNKK